MRIFQEWDGKDSYMKEILDSPGKRLIEGEILGTDCLVGKKIMDIKRPGEESSRKIERRLPKGLE